MKRLNQEFIENEFKKEGYQLLEEYKSSNKPVSIICPKGHISKKKYINWVYGSRCFHCRNERLHNNSSKHSLEYIRDKFKEIGYELLEESYKNARQKLKFKCQDDHEGLLTWNEFLNGRRCSKCSSISILAEENCRRIFEKIFGKEFKKSRPKWLINNKTNKVLELDGYNQELKIAFEYKGINCYNQTSEKEIERQKFIDKLKIELCQNMGIKLIVIHHYESDIEGFVLKQI